MLLGPPLWGLAALLTVLTASYVLSAVPIVSKYARYNFRVNEYNGELLYFQSIVDNHDTL